MSVSLGGPLSFFFSVIVLSLKVAGAASFLPWRSSKLKNKVRSLEQRLEGRDSNLGALGIQSPRPSRIKADSVDREEIIEFIEPGVPSPSVTKIPGSSPQS